ncbi:ganglioside GM2 activator-like isoform X1 [Haliotis rubra]|uniref:ganglioside GM2 activator-like isoform X1 n=1 Tax=Haliotis rubra TaxID=36100 RepID=UPI001EE60685|nr:ganglioside GM2 activator-like isoform X1 [Haliotis rubra]
MLLLVVALIVPALGARPGFTSTGNLEWRDCGIGDSWMSVKKFDISPNPVVLPGDITVTLEGEITHDLANQVTMDVLMEKKLLGTFIKVPCTTTGGSVGTCHYTDPCHCLNFFKHSGTCPPFLTANGLPCTCPFNPDKLSLPASKFTVTGINRAWKLVLEDSEYHVKITVNEKPSGQLRGCLEVYLNINVKQ